jgi:hypothetical protein
MNYCKRKNEPTDTVHCLNCEHCLPPGERTDGRMCRDEATVIELHGLLVQANRRRKAAERTVRKMRSTIRRINDDAMTAISSRQRTIEVQWEVMRELQRRGLVSTEDLEAVLKAIKHVVNYNRQRDCPIRKKVKM